MKPVQIVLLVVAGALGGAVLTQGLAEAATPTPAPPAVAAGRSAGAGCRAAGPGSRAARRPASAPARAGRGTRSPRQPRPERGRRRAPVRRRGATAAARRQDASASGESAARSTTARVEPPAAAPRPRPRRAGARAPRRVSTPPARPEPEHVTPPPPPPPPAPNRVTLNAGMLIPVRLVDGLSSERNMPGDTFTATLDKELVVDGFVIAERGARVEGGWSSVDRGGKVKGVAHDGGGADAHPHLRRADGPDPDRRFRAARRGIATRPTRRRSAAARRSGAIIGAIAGGGKGAAIGAGVGGGAGAGDVLLTRGKPVAFPSETRISFRLRAPVTITERR